MSIPKYDIFRNEGDGKVLWLDMAATFEDAQTRVRTFLAQAKQHEYLILDQSTGQKVLVNETLSQSENSLSAA